MAMDDRREVSTDQDQVHAGVWAGALLERGERLPVGLDHPEREHGGLADGGMDDAQLLQLVLVRRLHRDAALLRAAAAAAAGEHGDERGGQRDSVTEMLALLTALALVPTPIGTGPRYHPTPGVHGLCVAAPLDRGARVHLELFAGGRVVIVPAAVGVARRAARAWAGYRRALSSASLDDRPDGRRLLRRRGFTLGGVFAVWGQPLGPQRLLGFRDRVRVYVNGLRRTVDPRQLRLRDGDEIVLEVGPMVPPHRSYRFPRR